MILKTWTDEILGSRVPETRDDQTKSRGMKIRREKRGAESRELPVLCVIFNGLTIYFRGANMGTENARTGSRPTDESRRSTRVPGPRSGSIDPGPRNAPPIPNPATLFWLGQLLNTQMRTHLEATPLLPRAAWIENSELAAESEYSSSTYAVRCTGRLLRPRLGPHSAVSLKGAQSLASVRWISSYAAAPAYWGRGAWRYRGGGRRSGPARSRQSTCRFRPRRLMTRPCRRRWYAAARTWARAPR